MGGISRSLNAFTMATKSTTHHCNEIHGQPVFITNVYEDI